MYHPEMRGYHYVSYKGPVMIFQPHDGTRLSGQIDFKWEGYTFSIEQKTADTAVIAVFAHFQDKSTLQQRIVVRLNEVGGVDSLEVGWLEFGPRGYVPSNSHINILQGFAKYFGDLPEGLQRFLPQEVLLRVEAESTHGSLTQ